MTTTMTSICSLSIAAATTVCTENMTLPDKTTARPTLMRMDYLLEGMACPGGCVAGAGTLLPINRASNAVKKYTSTSKTMNANDSEYKEYLDLLIEKYK